MYENTVQVNAILEEFTEQCSKISSDQCTKSSFQIYFILYVVKDNTKHLKAFYLQMYNIQDYITYLVYKQKKLCSELLISLKK